MRLRSTPLVPVFGWLSATVTGLLEEARGLQRSQGWNRDLKRQWKERKAEGK